MTTHITKTWFDGKNIVTQEIPVGEVYKREWVGLTDDEVKDAFVEWGKADDASFTAFVQFIEAKLKEKNT